MKIIDINGKERECEKAFPDPAYPGFMRVEFVNPKRSYHIWYPIDDFLKNNPTMGDSTEGMSQPAEAITSTVTSATKTTLTDNTQKWDENGHIGMKVWIARGPGEHESKEIIANTVDTLILKENWKMIPNRDSQYVISSEDLVPKQD